MHAPRPTYPTSTLLTDGTFDKFRCHRGDGDMGRSPGPTMTMLMTTGEPMAIISRTFPPSG